MAFTGQTINNPVSGEQITFLQTAADTAGELLEFELELSPDGHVPGAHVHPEQEERFHVLEGTMKFRMGLRRIVAEAGDTVVVPESGVTVEEEGTRMFLFEGGVNLEDIVRAVNQVGAAPGDIVAILEALKQAGALKAELEVI